MPPRFLEVVFWDTQPRIKSVFASFCQVLHRFFLPKTTARYGTCSLSNASNSFELLVSIRYIFQRLRNSLVILATVGCCNHHHHHHLHTQYGTGTGTVPVVMDIHTVQYEYEYWIL